MAMERPPVTPTSGHRSRESRTFSFRSDKSGDSKGRSEALVESPREKEQRDRIWNNQSKANPNAAMIEAQPGDAAVQEKSTIEALSGYAHKDAFGNPIVDPDRSNPTRPRLERPLDTIRSFEKAIDNGYKRRSSYNNRAESYDQGQANGGRRNSGFSSAGNYDRPQHGGGYYGGQRPDSYAGGPRPRFGNPRMQSEPHFHANRPYGHHGFQQSSHTMNTDGSDSTGPWNSHTDPSSENSSLDRGPTSSRAQQTDGYAQNGYAGYGPGGSGFQGPIYEEQSQGVYGGGQGQYDDGYGQFSAPAPPVQAPPVQRRPIPLGNSGNGPAPGAGTYPEPAEKRKSWLSRRFSKRS